MQCEENFLAPNRDLFQPHQASAMQTKTIGSFDKIEVRCHTQAMMTKFEKRLSLLVICFVIVYLAAAGLTVHKRITRTDRTIRIESTGPPPGESEMMLAELFLPMLIVLTVAVSFVVVRRKRAASLEALDESEDEEIVQPPD